jgi:hypothetical protein
VVVEAADLVLLPAAPAAQLLFLLGRLFILHTPAAQQVAVQATVAMAVMDIRPYLTYCYFMEAVEEVVLVILGVVVEMVDAAAMAAAAAAVVVDLPELVVPAGLAVMA